MTYYDIDGNALSNGLAWVAAYEAAWAFGEARIGYTESADDCHISTVWLGLNHNFSRNGPPLIFETMVFGGALDGYQERYSTKELAAEGHARWVQTVRDAEEVTAMAESIVDEATRE